MKSLRRSLNCWLCCHDDIMTVFFTIFYVFIYTGNPSLDRKLDLISLTILTILRSTEYHPVQWLARSRRRRCSFFLTSLLDLEPIEGLPSCGFGVMICNKALLGARAKAETRPEDDRRWEGGYLSCLNLLCSRLKYKFSSRWRRLDTVENGPCYSGYTFSISSYSILHNIMGNTRR